MQCVSQAWVFWVFETYWSIFWTHWDSFLGVQNDSFLSLFTGFCQNNHWKPWKFKFLCHFTHKYRFMLIPWWYTIYHTPGTVQTLLYWKHLSEIMIDHDVSWLIVTFHDWSFFSLFKIGQLSFPILLISWSTLITNSQMSCADQSCFGICKWPIMIFHDTSLMQYEMFWDGVRCIENL